MEMLGQKAMLSGLCRYCQPLSHQVGGHHHASSMIVSGGCRSLAMQVWQPALVLHGMLGLHHQCHAVCRAMCRTLNQPCSQCAVSYGPPVASLAAHDLRMCCVDCCATAELQHFEHCEGHGPLSHRPCTAVHSQKVTGEEEHLLRLGTACPEAFRIRAGSRNAQVSHATCAAELHRDVPANHTFITL